MKRVAVVVGIGAVRNADVLGWLGASVLSDVVCRADGYLEDPLYEMTDPSNPGGRATWPMMQHIRCLLVRRTLSTKAS